MQESQTTPLSLGLRCHPNLIAWRSKSESNLLEMRELVCNDSVLRNPTNKWIKHYLPLKRGKTGFVLIICRPFIIAYLIATKYFSKEDQNEKGNKICISPQTICIHPYIVIIFCYEHIKVWSMNAKILKGKSILSKALVFGCVYLHIKTIKSCFKDMHFLS